MQIIQVGAQPSRALMIDGIDHESGLILADESGGWPIWTSLAGTAGSLLVSEVNASCPIGSALVAAMPAPNTKVSLLAMVTGAAAAGMPITPSPFKSWWKLVSSDSSAALVSGRAP